MKAGNVEYIMSKTMADELLKTRRAEEKKMQPKDFLVKCVNEEFGLMYNCTKVTIN